MRIVISDKERSALIDIRGMPERVFAMVYDFQQENGKNVLEGDDADFDELLRLISEEIGVGLCRKKNIPIFLRVCKKIDPESLNLDWAMILLASTMPLSSGSHFQPNGIP